MEAKAPSAGIFGKIERVFIGKLERYRYEFFEDCTLVATDRAGKEYKGIYGFSKQGGVYFSLRNSARDNNAILREDILVITGDDTGKNEFIRS